MKILLASGNAGKLREIEALTEGLPIEWCGLADFPALEIPPEDGETFVDNALLKAASACAQTGLPTLADDSGICVDALDGGPGIHSARFAGTHGADEANNDLLLERLTGVPDADRGAHFHCSIAIVSPLDHSLMRFPAPEGVLLTTRHSELREGQYAWVAEGQVHGRIAHERAGQGGFGYDCLFHHPASGCTFGELDPVVKNGISHRATALAKVRVLLERAASAAAGA